MISSTPEITDGFPKETGTARPVVRIGSPGQNGWAGTKRKAGGQKGSDFEKPPREDGRWPGGEWGSKEKGGARGMFSRQQPQERVEAGRGVRQSWVLRNNPRFLAGATLQIKRWFLRGGGGGGQLLGLLATGLVPC